MDALDTSIGAGGFLGLLLAAGHCARGLTQRNILAACFLSCLGFLQIVSALVHSNRLAEHSVVAFLLLPAILLAGPLLFLFYRSLIDDTPLAPRVILHFLPAAAAMLLQAAIPAATAVPANRRLTLIAMVSVLSYISVLFFQLRQIYATSKGRRTFSGLVSAGVYLGLALAALIGLILDASALTRAVNIAVTILLLCLYLAEARYPDLLGDLAQQMRRRRENSYLRRLDLQDLRKKLLHLMEAEKVFCDEDLTLPSLAAMAGISTHQLSEYINQHMNKNFNRFINEFRITEACAHLRDEPDRSILSVGLAVGFNSNSAFHESFREFTGLTPARFRKLQNKKDSEL